VTTAERIGSNYAPPWPSFATREDLEGLPPIVIGVNECDPLRDEGISFYRLLLNSGVPARCRQNMGEGRPGLMRQVVCAIPSRRSGLRCAPVSTSNRRDYGGESAAGDTVWPDLLGEHTVMSISIRTGVPEDRDAILRVHQDSVRALCVGQYSSDQIDAWLDGRDATMYLAAIERGELWVAATNDAIVGFTEVEGNEVTKLFVCGASAGSGVGRALMGQAIQYLTASGHTRIRLESTKNAHDFYRRLGFVQTGTGTFSHGRGEISLEIIEMELHCR
jgi:putative acetyltransferase